MAAVDSFQLLLKEIFKTCSHLRDAFAILGALYTARKAIRLTRCLLSVVNDHVLSQLGGQWDLRKEFGPWAVVTGSSEGIGRAYAQELASRGLNIVLISRGEKRLEKAATEIGEQFQVETCYIAVDFNNTTDTYKKIEEGIKDKNIGILVNNVGVMYDFPQYFLDVPRERLWQLINVNVAAATMMTHMILPQMVQRRKGAVVMVSSGACSQITPQMTVYAATKSFLDYFARSLNYEYKDKGIIVQSLMPFYVATRMTRYSETLSNTNLFIPTASVYARNAIKTLGYTARTSGYLPHAFQSWLCNLIPEWQWMWGASRLNTALREQALRRGPLHLHESPSDQSLDSSTPT
ncbi:inactive hydroxysteroid dehydrogenase-like protein 1 [Haliotis rubra]|uniref:inactive hydroxysteroid dehydrogenase-like protein 1 n=1 Tax=Haliotis rubra TaxID=36100 RepID=UPI001EE51710|nr:inactive hydroxysteroid dehydrogenase-like protein 1 [Haliotis rubra]